MIATRSSDNPGRWDRAREQIGKGATRLEGAGVLEQFELERKRLC